MWRCGLVMIWALSAVHMSLLAEDRVQGAYNPLAKIHAEKVVPLDLTISLNGGKVEGKTNPSAVVPVGREGSLATRVLVVIP